MKDFKKNNDQFYLGEKAENPLAEITFAPTGEDKIIIDHTYVSGSLKGQGVGKQLVEKVVEYARQENIKIIPQCAFAKSVLTKNDEYKDVLVEE